MHPEEKSAVSESVYIRAVKTMDRAYLAEQYIRAAEMFSGIADYKDSAALAENCRKLAEEHMKKAGEKRRKRVYYDIRQRMNGKTVEDYKDALILLQTVPDWKEVEKRTAECHRRIAEIQAQEAADALERERQAEIARQTAARIARRKKRTRIGVAVTVALAAALTSLWIYVIHPAIQYSDANTWLDEGNVVDAYETLIKLGDYKDSVAIAASVFNEYKVEKLKVAEAGDYLFFGTYEQDNRPSNGKEELEWLVLDTTDERVLVISKYALECRQFHTEWESVTWETSTLRQWLNNDFMNDAFSPEQQTQIPTVSVSADINPEYETDPGNATQDKVFLLSVPEAGQYFSSRSARQCLATAYAAANGAEEDKDGNCSWWLRTPGFAPRITTSVLKNGRVFEGGGSALDMRVAVRPVLWIERTA